MIYHTLQNELGRRWQPPHLRRNTISSTLRSLSSNPKRPLSNMTTDMLFSTPLIQSECMIIECLAFSLSFDLAPSHPRPLPSASYSLSQSFCVVSPAELTDDGRGEGRSQIIIQARKPGHLKIKKSFNTLWLQYKPNICMQRLLLVEAACLDEPKEAAKMTAISGHVHVSADGSWTA